MTFKEFLKLTEDAGVVGAVYQGQEGDGPNNAAYARKGIRSKYMSKADDGMKPSPKKKVADSPESVYGVPKHIEKDDLALKGMYQPISNVN